MTSDQIDRALAIGESFAISFAHFVSLMDKRLEKEFPPAPEIEDAQIVRVGEGGADEPTSRQEYEDFPAGETTSFEKLLETLKNPKG